MEVQELFSFYLNPTSNLLEVTFRLIGDEEDTIRTDKIEIQVAEDYGYTLAPELDGDFFDDDDEEYADDFDEFDVFLDEDEVISFLNEYYMVNPDLLPDSELY